jgi:hypothetical protein
MLALLSMTASLATLPSAAQAACPTSETARKGFIMKTNQNLVWDVTGYEGDAANVVETIPTTSGRGLVRRLTLDHGIVTVKIAGPDYTLTTTFDPPLQSFFPLTMGKKELFKMVRRLDAKPDVIARLKMKPEVPGTTVMGVTTSSTLRVGDCSYDTIQIVRGIRFDDAPQFTIAQLYSPDLRMTLNVVQSQPNPGKEPTRSATTFVSIVSK